MFGTLYLVATPIGNLEDITHRAVRVLREVAVIAAEDTRHTRKLLNHFSINTRTVSYHEHNERERASELLEELQNGSDVAIVSDAGTPAINDPGFRLTQLAIDNDIRVVPIPGASAPLAALIASGLPTDEFLFVGFLPSRASARRARLEELKTVAATLVFFESPHRIAATLGDAAATLGNRKAVVARELTKIHEEFVRGTLSELASRFSGDEQARGEFVLIIDGAGTETTTETSSRSVAEIVAALEEGGLDHRAALKKAARELGLTRDEAYRRLMAERGK